MPNTAEKLHTVYLVKGALATTAIEGNTLTEKEVLERLEGKLRLPPSKENLGQEIDNLIEACNLIANELFDGTSTDICVEDINLNYAPIIYSGLKRLDYKARFMILILTIWVMICLRVKITPASLYIQAFSASLR